MRAENSDVVNAQRGDMKTTVPMTKVRKDARKAASRSTQAATTPTRVRTRTIAKGSKFHAYQMFSGSGAGPQYGTV